MELYSEDRFREAVHFCWKGREDAQQRQVAEGVVSEVGLRSGVTSGKHLDPLAEVVADIFVDAGVLRSSIHFKKKVELPGFYRPTKKWDIVVVHDDELVATVELKSILGSYGNNLNNRTEEAIGNAVDLLEAFEEGLLGRYVRAPWMGYLFVMQRDEESTSPVAVREPHFPTDPAFKGASYLQRAELLGRRLMQKRLYSAACLVVSDGSGPSAVEEPGADLTFAKFAAGISGCVGEVLA